MGYLESGTIIGSGTVINFGVFLDSGTIILAVLLFDTPEYRLSKNFVARFARSRRAKKARRGP